MGVKVRIVKKTHADGREIGFALELETKGRFGSLPIQSIELGRKELLALRKEIDHAIGLTELTSKLEVSTEQALKIVEKHSSYWLCRSCELYMKECFDCVLTYTDPVDNYVFRSLASDGLSKPEIVRKIAEFGEEIRREHETHKDCGFNFNNWRDGQCSEKNERCLDCLYTCESPLERTLFMALVVSYRDIELQKRIYKDGRLESHPQPIDLSSVMTIPDFYLEANGKKICIYADGFSYHNKEREMLRDRRIDRELQKLGFVTLRFPTKDITENLRDAVESIQETVNSAM
jgi:ferredoxin